MTIYNWSTILKINVLVVIEKRDDVDVDKKACLLISHNYIFIILNNSTYYGCYELIIKLYNYEQIFLYSDMAYNCNKF